MTLKKETNKQVTLSKPLYNLLISSKQNEVNFFAVTVDLLYIVSVIYCRSAIYRFCVVNLNIRTSPGEFFIRRHLVRSLSVAISVSSP